MNTKRLILFLCTCCLIIFLPACEEATDWDFQTGENGKLVVEAIITNKQEIQEVKLSYSFNDINGIPRPASDAIVYISNGVDDFPFIESTINPGTYQLPQPGAAQAGVTYELVIELDNQTYSATNSMVEVSSFDAPNFAFAKDSINLILTSTPPLYSTTEQAMYEIDIDWSAISSEQPNTAKQVLYTFKTIDVNEIFKSEPKEVKFPIGSRVIVTKYGLNDGFASYLRALVMETEWQGSPFDEASSSLPTNISGDGLGYFGVCAIQRDTFYAE